MVAVDLADEAVDVNDEATRASPAPVAHARMDGCQRKLKAVNHAVSRAPGGVPPSEPE